MNTYVLYAFLSSNPDRIWHRSSVRPWENDRPGERETIPVKSKKVPDNC